MERWLIDTDPGVDDALAIMMAHRLPGISVSALTLAAGNVGIDHTTANAMKLLDVLNVDTPVHIGAPVPLVRSANDAAFVHGLDGFGDIGYTPSQRFAEAEHAVQAIIRLARLHAGALNMIMLGPLAVRSFLSIGALLSVLGMGPVLCPGVRRTISPTPGCTCTASKSSRPAWRPRRWMGPRPSRPR